MDVLPINKENTWTRDNQFKVVREALNYWFQIAALHQFARLRLELDVQLSAPLPSGPKIFAGNHPTTTDPFFLITVLREKTRVMVNSDIFSKPVIGGLMRRSGHIPVDKKDGLASLHAGVEALQRGDNVAIFPEGALSDLTDGIQVNRLKTGAVRMALMANVPIIPVGFHLPVDGISSKRMVVGGEEVVSRFYFAGRYGITLGRPLWLHGDVEDRELVRVYTEELRERIYNLSQVSALRLKNNLPLSVLRRRKKKSVTAQSRLG